MVSLPSPTSNSVNSFIEQVVYCTNNIVAKNTPESLSKPLEYILKLAGKHLRPKIYFHCSHIFSPEKAPDPFVGAMLETIHIASLLHDDVLDNSNLRRNLPTVRNLWSNKTSILLGDFLLGWAQVQLYRGKLQGISPIISPLLEKMSLGEFMHLELKNSREWKQSLYLKVVEMKTASLFSASAQLGCSDDTAKSSLLAKFGNSFGIFYQYYDDWADYYLSEEITGKAKLQDLKNGSPTWPVILIYEHGCREEKEILQKAFRSSDEKDVDRLLDLLQKPRFRNLTRQMLLEKYEEVCKEIDHFPKNPYQEELSNMIHQIIANMG